MPGINDPNWGKELEQQAQQDLSHATYTLAPPNAIPPAPLVAQPPIVVNTVKTVTPFIQQVQQTAQNVIQQAQNYANQAIKAAAPLVDATEFEIDDIGQNIKQQTANAAGVIHNAMSQAQQDATQAAAKVSSTIQQIANSPAGQAAQNELANVEQQAHNAINNALAATQQGVHSLINAADSGIKQIVSNPIDKTVENAFNQVKTATNPTIQAAGQITKDIASNYIKALENSYTGQQPSQDDLKAIYDAENAQPWWMQQLLGLSVLKLPDGTYSQLNEMMLPIAPGGFEGEIPQVLKSLKVIGAADIGMDDAQYIRFINSRIANPELSPETFKAIDGAISNMNRSSNAFDLLEEGRQRSIQIGNQAEKITSGKFSVRNQGVYRPDYTGESTPNALKTEIASSTIKDAELTDVAKAQTLIDNNAVAHALVSDPAATEQLIKSAPPIVRSALLLQVTQGIAKAISQSASTSTISAMAQKQIAQQDKIISGIKAMTQAAQKVIADTGTTTQPSTKQAAKLQSTIQTAVNKQVNIISDPQVKAQLKTYVQPVTKAATQQLVQTVTKVQVKPSLQTATQTATKTQTQTQTRTQPELQTKTQTRTQTKQATETPIREKIQSPTNRPDEPTTPPEMRLGSSTVTVTDKKGRTVYLTDKSGAIGWKQGIMYVVKWKPYENEDNTHYSHEPVPGIPYFTGIGSAAKSLVKLYGEVPKHLKFAMGFENTEIYSRQGQPMITFAHNSKARGNGGSRPYRIRRPIRISREDRAIREIITGG